MPISVLIVEDDPQCAKAFADAVRAADDMRLVGVAADFPEGLRLLEASKPDVMLVDIGLPSGSGIGLIEHAQKRLPQCESLVITVFADNQLVLQCVEAGAGGYLLKDANAMDVTAQIRLLLDGGSPISPAIARNLLRRLKADADEKLASGGTEVTLSKQEESVLSLSAKGYNYEEVAGLLGVSRNTVETYVKRIYRKLQVHSKTEAIFEARKLRLVRD